MKSKKGPSKRKSKKKICKGKEKHKSFDVAMNALKAVSKNDHFFRRMNAYQCPFCKEWHIGHY
jgi:hypothetical protein